MNIFERIEKETQLTPSEIAKRLGISKSYYSMIRNGDRQISKNVAIKIHLEFAIPLEDILMRPEVHDEATRTPPAGTLKETLDQPAPSRGGVMYAAAFKFRPNM